jgi:hypothetical protein
VAAHVYWFAEAAVDRPEPCVRVVAVAFAGFVLDVAHRPAAAECGAVLATFGWGQSQAGLAELQRHPVPKTVTPPRSE